MGTKDRMFPDRFNSDTYDSQQRTIERLTEMTYRLLDSLELDGTGDDTMLVPEPRNLVTYVIADMERAYATSQGYVAVSQVRVWVNALRSVIDGTT